MSEKTFSNLVNQLSSEAEEQKQDEVRAKRRSEIIRSVCRIALLLLLGGAAIASGTYYRDDLGRLVENLTSAPTPQVNPQAKVKQIKALAEKRDQTLEDISK